MRDQLPAIKGFLCGLCPALYTIALLWAFGAFL